MIEQNGIAPFRCACTVQTGWVMTIVSGTSAALILSKHGSRKYSHSLSFFFGDERFLGCRSCLFVLFCLLLLLLFLAWHPPPTSIYIYIKDFWLHIWATLSQMRDSESRDRKRGWVLYWGHSYWARSRRVVSSKERLDCHCFAQPKPAFDLLTHRHKVHQERPYVMSEPNLAFLLPLSFFIYFFISVTLVTSIINFLKNGPCSPRWWCPAFDFLSITVSELLHA